MTATRTLEVPACESGEARQPHYERQRRQIRGMPIAGRGMLVNVMDVEPPTKPITAQASPVPGAGEELFGGQAPVGVLVSRRTCRLMWDPSKAELNR